MVGSSVAVVPGVRSATTVHSLSTSDRYGPIVPAWTAVTGEGLGATTATLGAGAAVLGPGPSADPSTGLAPGLDPGRPVGPQGCQTSTASVDAIARTAAVARLAPPVRTRSTCSWSTPSFSPIGPIGVRGAVRPVSRARPRAGAWSRIRP